MKETNWAANLASNLRTMAKAAVGFYATEQAAR
jgi:hypothetical protein